MVQRGQEPCFTVESRESIGIVRQARREELDRDVAAERRIDRLPHDPHPAFADLLGQAVVQQGNTGLDCHGAHHIAPVYSLRHERRIELGGCAVQRSLALTGSILTTLALASIASAQTAPPTPVLIE